MQYFNYILAVWLILIALIMSVTGRGIGYLFGLIFFKLFPLVAGIVLIVQTLK